MMRRILFCATVAFAVMGFGAQAQSPATSPAASAKQAPAKEGFRTWSWNKVSGNWKRMKGAVKERWGRLTHNDIRESQGRRETLNGYIQSRYGIDRDAADKQIDEWLKTLK
ncbi:uncharacterized protein YjbJ (UPF0337 family) [Pseudorhodoplanes sinuspersici]|nr:uncharacterized protein YjbJ (UPF0337 family) [Pseudorhodoplanes sinuspersici]